MASPSLGTRGTRFARAVRLISLSISPELNLPHRVYTLNVCSEEPHGTIPAVRVTVDEIAASLNTAIPRIANIYFLALVVFQGQYGLANRAFMGRALMRPT